MTRPPPPWLADFQARFGAVVRAPLDRSTGSLMAMPERYDARTVAETAPGPSVSAADRLAVYNRQAWFRFFDVLQSAFPLVCRLLGAWTFNDHAARHLLAHPPRGWDLDRLADGFEAWLAADLAAEGPPHRDALVEAARIDAAFREVFQAPPVVTFRPSADDAARLLDARLTPSPALVVVEEHYPLLELRRRVMGDPSERRVPLPPASARAVVAIVRTDRGTTEVGLEPREAELLALLRESSVREALGRLEAACSPGERVELPANARRWLARGVELGFWCGAAWLED